MSTQITDPGALTMEEKARIVETSEANMFRAVWDGLPASSLEAYGASRREVGGATAAVFKRLPIAVFNRVVGLGVHEPATEAMIDELMALYDDAGTPFGISVSPAARPAEISEWLLARGFEHTSNWAKVIRGTEPPPEIETELRIEQADETTAAQYAAVGQVAFEMPEWTKQLFEEMAMMPEVMSYVAFAGDEPAGIGSMLIAGEYGALFNGATLPDYRRRGAQGAIMARRIREGIAGGCRWLTTETGEDTPESPNPSYRNMIRTGFQLAYLRPNYTYRADKAEE